MARLEWTPDLDTGIEVIDGQHKRIVEYINQLDAAIRGNDRSQVGDVIDAAIDYTFSHFSFEEAMIEDAGYELTRPHIKVHEKFIKSVSDLKIRFGAGEDVSGDLHSLLAGWLFGHIRNDDKAYAAAIRPRLQDSAMLQQKTDGWLKRFFRR